MYFLTKTNNNNLKKQILITTALVYECLHIYEIKKNLDVQEYV